MNSARHGLACFLLLALSSVSAQAETSDALRELVGKITTLQQGAFQVAYSAKMSTDQLGSRTTIDMTGTLTQADPLRQRNELTAVMEGVPGMPGPTEMRVISVLDGETMWIEQDNPMMGRMVLKLGVEQIGELGKLGGGAGGNFGVDPISQILEMIDRADLERTGSEEGRVRLAGSLAKSAGADAPPIAGLDRFELVVDESTGVPVEFSLGGEMMVVRFSEFRKLDADSIAGETFRYSAPEGVQVMDVGAMLSSMPGVAP